MRTIKKLLFNGNQLAVEIDFGDKELALTVNPDGYIDAACECIDDNWKELTFASIVNELGGIRKFFNHRSFYNLHNTLFMPNSLYPLEIKVASVSFTNNAYDTEWYYKLYTVTEDLLVGKPEEVVERIMAEGFEIPEADYDKYCLITKLPVKF